MVIGFHPRIFEANDVKSWATAFDECDYFRLDKYFEGQAHIINAVKSLGDTDVLELGAGTGLTSILLSKQGKRVVSLDIDYDVCSRLKGAVNKFNALVEIVRADAKSLPFRNNAFGLSFSQGLLEHFSDSEITQILREQKRVATRLVVEVPSEKWLRAPTSTWFYGDERFLSLGAWKKLIKASQLLISAEYGWGFQGRYKRLKQILPEILWMMIAPNCADVLGFVLE